MYDLDDTIAAIASPPGGAARGIVRLSGPRVLSCVRPHFQADASFEVAALAQTTVVTGSLRVPRISSLLPCDLYLWPDRRSYTGQRVAELHTLGSPPLLDALLQALCAAGARLAEPGEFTLRAFLAGRIDLTQAEAVLGVIDAANAGELEVALSQLAGGLAGPLHQLRDALLELLARLEAGFDFADEDISLIAADELDRQLGEAATAVERLAQQMDCRAETLGAVRAVLVGAANAGKSSLFNALVGTVGALVSEHAGTTRDYLTAELDLDGVKCRLIDTAGLQPELARPPRRAECHSAPLGGDVEHLAQAVSAQQQWQAHVQIVCLDSTRSLLPWERHQLTAPADGRRIVALTKTDAPTALPHSDIHAVRTSSLTGAGLELLRRELRTAALAAAASGAGVVAGTAARCRESIRLAADGLAAAQRIARTGSGEELVVTELRVALEELGKVAGAVYTDDVLDCIFSRFCIGK